jgi:hypothetical protein
MATLNMVSSWEMVIGRWPLVVGKKTAMDVAFLPNKDIAFALSWQSAQIRGFFLGQPPRPMTNDQ